MAFFEAVFFDMDGLMVDSEPQWFESECEVMAPFGYEWQNLDQIECLGGPLSRVGRYMSDKTNGQKPPDFFTQELIRVQAEKMRSAVPVMPGALELVQELQSHSIPTALVSASPRLIVDAVLGSLGHNLFPFSLSSDDVVRTKPHPDVYLKAADLVGVDITESLIFEDSLTGVQAATSSGAYLIAVPHLVTVEEAARLRVISSLEELSFKKLQELRSDFSKDI